MPKPRDFPESSPISVSLRFPSPSIIARPLDSCHHAGCSERRVIDWMDLTPRVSVLLDISWPHAYLCLSTCCIMYSSHFATVRLFSLGELLYRVLDMCTHDVWLTF